MTDPTNAFSVFAIRESGTDKYMPAHKAGSRGFSIDEPVAGGGKLGPRFFISRRRAEYALRAWKAGVTQYDSRDTGDWFADADRSLVTKPVPERVLRQIEVVEFALTEVAA